VTWLRYRMREEGTARSVHLLISYAVRYPEIATVRYDPRRQTLRFSFLLRGAMDEVAFAQAERTLQETLEVYHMIEQRRAAVVEASYESLGELTTLALERDISTLTPEEIYTVVEVLRDRYPGRVLAEAVDFLGEEELLAQDEMIEEMLASLAERRNSSNLIAIREDGRLMFFHK
jgi:hypothetical protein